MQLKFGLPAKHSCPVHKPQIKAKEFFTTRFVEATSPDEAASKAIDAVREEMNAFFQMTHKIFGLCRLLKCGRMHNCLTLMPLVRETLQFFGDRTLAQITSRLIVEYKRSRSAVGVKAATINRELTCLKRALPSGNGSGAAIIR